MAFPSRFGTSRFGKFRFGGPDNHSELSGTQPQAGTSTRQVSIHLSGTQSQTATASRGFAYLEILTTSQAQTGATTRIASHQRALSATQAQSGSVARQSSDRLSGTQGASGTSSRVVNHRLSGTQGQTSSITADTSASDTVTVQATQGQAGSIKRVVHHVRSVSQRQVGTLVPIHGVPPITATLVETASWNTTLTELNPIYGTESFTESTFVRTDEWNITLEETDQYTISLLETDSLAGSSIIENPQVQDIISLQNEIVAAVLDHPFYHSARFGKHRFGNFRFGQAIPDNPEADRIATIVEHRDIWDILLSDNPSAVVSSIIHKDPVTVTLEE